MVQMLLICFVTAILKCKQQNGFIIFNFLSEKTHIISLSVLYNPVFVYMYYHFKLLPLFPLTNLFNSFGWKE